jgi:hypothetical protein
MTSTGYRDQEKPDSIIDMEFILMFLEDKNVPNKVC